MDHSNKNNDQHKSLRPIFILLAAIAVLFVLIIFCPYVPEIVMEALFERNFRIGVFVFLIIILCTECVFISYLKKDGKALTKRAAALIIAVASIVGSVLLLSNSNTFTDDDFPFFTYIKANDDPCLIEIYKSAVHDDPQRYDSYLDRVVFLHYFKGKTLALSSDMEAGERIAAHFSAYAPSIPLVVNDTIHPTFTSAQMDEVMARCYSFDKNDWNYILDKTWRRADRIYGVEVDGTVYFMSSKLYDDISAGSAERDFSKAPGAVNDYTAFMEPFADVYHLVIVAVMFALGWLLCTIAFDGKRRALTAFMAFPTGIAMACAAGVLFIIIGIPFRKLTLLVAAVLMFAALGFIFFRKKIHVDRLATIKTYLAMAVIALAVIWGKTGSFSPPDSIHKTINGLMLTEYSLSRSDVLSFISFGFMEPIIHGISWKFGVDYLYSFYALMAICSLGIMGAGIVSLSPGIDRRLLIFITAASIAFVATNIDFIACGAWVLSNGAIATYTLIITVCIYIAIADSKSKVAWPICLACVAFIITRLEGACFIVLMLGLALGIRSFRDRYWGILVAAGVETVIWSVYNIVFNRTNDEFWSPSKALVLLAGGIALIAAAFISRIKWMPVQWIMKHLYLLAAIGLVAVSVFSITYNGSYGIRTFQIYAKHFATSVVCNSAGMWAYLALLIPLIVQGRKKEGAMGLVMVAGYLLLAMDILTFRMRGDMIHIHMGDSGRRMMQQVYPAALFVTAYCVEELPQFDDVTAIEPPAGQDEDI